jgi:leukotriene-A4 hydrolase
VLHDPDTDLTQAWLHGTGMDLPVNMEYDTTLATEAYELADRWDKSRDTPVADLKFSSEDVAKLNSNQKSESMPVTSTQCLIDQI